jgi:hypothetical protein
LDRRLRGPQALSLIRNHINRLARVLYQKSVTSENSQIQDLGQYDPISDKYLPPLSLLARSPARYGSLKQCINKQLAEIGHYHYLNPYIILEPPSEQILKERKVSLQVTRIPTGSQRVQYVGGHNDKLPTLDNMVQQKERR